MTIVPVNVAALYLGCSTSHIHRLIHAGTLTNTTPHKKPWAVDLAQVEQAINEGKIIPNPTGKAR